MVKRNIIYIGTYSNQLTSGAKFQVAAENKERATRVLEELLVTKGGCHGLKLDDTRFKDITDTGNTYPQEYVFFYEHQ